MKGLLLLFLLSNGFAVTINDCVNEAQVLGDGQVALDLPAECYSVVKNNTSTYAHDFSLDKSIEVHIAENILYHKKPVKGVETIGKVSGANAVLTDTIAVDIDEASKMVAVLMGHPQKIYTYSIEHNGNIGPAYLFESPALINANNLLVIEESNELAVLFSSEGKIKVFNREANIRGAKPENALDIKREIYGAQTTLSAPVDMDYSNSRSELYILEPNNQVILVFNLSDSGDVAPKKIHPDSQLLNAIHIKYDEAAGKIKAILNDDSVFEIEP